MALKIRFLLLVLLLLVVVPAAFAQDVTGGVVVEEGAAMAHAQVIGTTSYSAVITVGEGAAAAFSDSPCPAMTYCAAASFSFGVSAPSMAAVYARSTATGPLSAAANATVLP